MEEASGMRQDVKRSLLLWPAAASLTISAASWLSTQVDSQRVEATSQRVVLGPPSVSPSVSSPVSLPMQGHGVMDLASTEIVARSEQGARAMPLPLRIAEAFGVQAYVVKTPVIKAPVLAAQRELAGLVVDPPAGTDPSIGQLAQGILRGDMLAADQIAYGTESLLPRSNRTLARRLLSPPLSSIPDLSNEIVDDSNRPPRVQLSPDDARSLEPPSPASWPVTTRLDAQLKDLSSLAVDRQFNDSDQFVSVSPHITRIGEWTNEVAKRLSELRALPRLGDERAEQAIEALASLAAEGQRRAERLQDRPEQVQWLVASHAIARRVSVWQLVWQVSRGGQTLIAEGSMQAPTQSVAAAIAEVRAELSDTGDELGWDRYLLLSELDQASTDVAGEERLILTQRFLSRLQWHRLTEDQRRWIERDAVRSLAEAVRPWAQNAVDYSRLLAQLELQETDAIDLASIDVASTVQTLRHSQNPLVNQLASVIDTHYRNANLRIALSRDLLQRFLPEVESKTVPVKTVVLGSRVRGVSQVDTDVAIELLPSADSWNLRLSAQGTATTRSTGVQDAVAVHTLGRSQFESGTEIKVTPRGVAIKDTDVNVRGSTALRGIDTDYDSWPLIGPLVQGIAESRYRSLAPQANRIANRTMQDRVESEIETMLTSRHEQATEQLRRIALGPLGKMQLDPKVTDLQSTDDRLMARFRIAGDWQMAAFTPRPRAPGSCLMSIQVHQSAANNVLAQLVPRGQPMPIHELLLEMCRTFGQEEISMPDDVPKDVTIQFAETRPITVEMQDDRLWITLRIVRLRRSDSVDLTQFIVKAAYKPHVEGTQASLVRDGHLRISGPRMSMRERLPARTIFNKVFSTNREIPLVAAQWQDHPGITGLAISQFELRDGWLAVALSDADAPRIALTP